MPKSKFTIKQLQQAGMHTVAFHNLNDGEIKCSNPNHPRHTISERDGFINLAKNHPIPCYICFDALKTDNPIAMMTVNNQQTGAIYPLCSKHTPQDFPIDLAKLDPNGTGQRYACKNIEESVIITGAVATS